MHFLKMAGNLKKAGRRVIRSEISDSGGIVLCICGTFDLLVFKVI